MVTQKRKITKLKDGNSQNITQLDLSYHKTIWDFMQCNEPVRVVVGPVGSGKSTGVGCGEIMRRAFMQEPSPIDNIRYFKALVVRKTMPELRKTTVKTWLGMYSASIGKYNQTELTHHIKMKPTETEPGLDLLVEFMGLDTPKDAEKLLSWEGTLIWFNEAKELNKDIIDGASARVGRYPSKKQGGIMPTWYGMIMDTNPYNSGHWLDKLEKEQPVHWEFFRQPPGVLEMEKTEDGWASIEAGWPLTITKEEYIHKGAGCEWAVNPQAENLKYLPVDRHIDPTQNPLKAGGYYPVIISGKDKSYINIYVQGKNGSLTAAHAVIPEFTSATMLSNAAEYNVGLPLQIGMDIGGGTLNPAAIFGQLDPIHNRWTILRELAGELSVSQFADQILITLNQYYPHANELKIWADPAGRQRDAIHLKDCFDHLATKGLYAFPAPSQNIETRIECIKAPMMRYANGHPAFIVHPRCTVLVEALTEKWSYRRLPLVGEIRYDDKPSKTHPYCDVADALGYLMVGGGEHRGLVTNTPKGPLSKGFIMETDWDVF